MSLLYLHTGAFFPEAPGTLQCAPRASHFKALLLQFPLFTGSLSAAESLVMHVVHSSPASTKMARSPRSATALVTISAFAVYIKYYSSFQNGFIEILSSMMAQDSLPGLPGHLCSEYTGIKPLDKFLAASNIYLWPIFQKQQEALILSFYGMAFAGAMVPLWQVIVAELHRRKRGFGVFMEYVHMVILGPKN